MRITDKITLAIMAAGICVPALAQDNAAGKPVHIKMIKIIDGDTTIVEKSMNEDELREFEKEMGAMRGKNMDMQMLIDRKGSMERPAEGTRFFFFNDSVNGHAMMKREMNFSFDSLTPAMRFHFYDSALPPGLSPEDIQKEFRFSMDSMITRECVRIKDGESFMMLRDSLKKSMENFSGYSFSISDENGEVVVKQFGPEGERTIVKKLEGKPGEELKEDVVIHSKDGKTVTRVRTVVKIEDVEKPSNEKSTKKEKSELKPQGLSFYPNPSNGRFTIEFEAEGKHPAMISITDMNGKEVYREEVNATGKHSSQIDLTKQGKGTYILNLRQGKRSATRKIVIE